MITPKKINVIIVAMTSIILIVDLKIKDNIPIIKPNNITAIPNVNSDKRPSIKPKSILKIPNGCGGG